MISKDFANDAGDDLSLYSLTRKGLLNQGHVHNRSYSHVNVNVNANGQVRNAHDSRMDRIAPLPSSRATPMSDSELQMLIHQVIQMESSSSTAQASAPSASRSPSAMQASFGRSQSREEAGKKAKEPK